MIKETVSPDFPYPSHYVEVYGEKMHYLDEGMGDPILFLHGMPTSSYVWRNIIPHLTALGRCIAVDLIGMGKSGKPDIEYTVFDHIKYISKFIETLNLKRVTLVMHGWGSVIGFAYAAEHAKNCKALAFYEAYLRPLHHDDFSLPLLEQLHTFDHQENIEDLVVNGTYLVDKVLTQEIMRPLTEAELACYREPFLKKGSGKALRQYLKELPRIDQTNSVQELIRNYAKKLTTLNLPKLMLYSVPGFITTIATVMWAKIHLPNLEAVEIGEELHFAQESNPALMGEAISVWLQGIEQQAG